MYEGCTMGVQRMYEIGGGLEEGITLSSGIQYIIVKMESGSEALKVLLQCLATPGDFPEFYLKE